MAVAKEVKEPFVMKVITAVIVSVLAGLIIEKMREENILKDKESG